MKIYILLIVIFSFIFLLSSILITVHLSNKSSKTVSTKQTKTDLLKQESDYTTKLDPLKQESYSITTKTKSAPLNQESQNEMKIITWNKILNDWENGKNIPFFKKDIKYRNNNFLFWITTPIYNGNLNSIFKQNLVPYNHSFSNNNIGFVDKLNNNNHVRFLSKNNNILLSPKFDKKFVSIKHFITEASFETQKSFWKFVSKEIKNILNENENENENKNKNKTLYIFTDGRAEPYLHVRIQINDTEYYNDIKKKI